METAKNAIEVTNLVKRYKELVALDHFNLTVKSGEIFGLLGPNGSGKTTTINCILSLLKYDKGDIKIFGKEMRPDSYDIKKDIGVIMQNVAVYDELTVYENIDYSVDYISVTKSCAPDMYRKQWILLTYPNIANFFQKNFPAVFFED